MGYIGNKPTAVPLTSADIEDGVVSAADLGANSVDSSELVDGSIDTSHIGALQVTDAKIADMSATKLTGSIADARIPASAVTQHVTAFDDTDLRNDIITLALKEAITENRVAYNLPNSMIEQFQDDSKIGSETTGDRNSSEYWETLVASNHTTTKVGSVARSSTQSKFGSYSAYFDGDGDRLNIANSGSLATFTGGTNNWTIDFWAYTDGTDSREGWVSHRNAGQSSTSAGGCFFGAKGGSTGYQVMGGDIGGSWYDNNQTPYFTGNENVVGNGWNHIAYTRNGSVFSFFRDGTRTSQFTVSGDLSNPDVAWCIGNHANNDETSTRFMGYIDEVRFSNNVRWDTTQFSPPTSAYSTDSNTVLLLHMDDTDLSDSSAVTTGTLISTAQTANAAQTKVSGVILYKNQAGTATLGTDLKIYFTCNGGTNWTESTPTAAGTFSSGILMAKCPEVTCTSGTDIRYKAVWANQASGSKETQLHGIGMNY